MQVLNQGRRCGINVNGVSGSAGAGAAAGCENFEHVSMLTLVWELGCACLAMSLLFHLLPPLTPPLQGPPGTGKTTAIIGMASALLVAGAAGTSVGAAAAGGSASSGHPPTAGGGGAAAEALQQQQQYKRYKQPSIANRRKLKQQSDEKARGGGVDGSVDGGTADAVVLDPWLSAGLPPRPPRRVLVCAQSNAAVDELVRKGRGTEQEGGAEGACVRPVQCSRR